MDVHGKREESVIAYGLVKEEEKHEVKSMEVGDNIESDHHAEYKAEKGGGERTGRGGRHWTQYTY